MESVFRVCHRDVYFSAHQCHSIDFMSMNRVSPTVFDCFFALPNRLRLMFGIVWHSTKKELPFQDVPPLCKIL